MGRRGGGGVGRGGAVRAVGDGPHIGLRVYRFGEVDAVDEADQLFDLLQGAVHLLLPGQDGILHFHAFLQRTRRAEALSLRSPLQDLLARAQPLRLALLCAKGAGATTHGREDSQQAGGRGQVSTLKANPA